MSLEPRADIDYPGGAGCCGIPTLTDNGDGSVVIGRTLVALYDTADGAAVPRKWWLPESEFTLTDGATNYIIADRYGNGVIPALALTTDVDVINETTIAPVFTIVRTGTVLHVIPWDSLGRALVNKLHQSIVKTQRYRRESGLALSEYGTRNLALTAGIIWAGAVKHELDAIDTAEDNIRYVYHVAGEWVTSSTATQYENTQYDDGTNLVELTANRFAVRWFFRGVETNKHLYMLFGTGDYTLAQAQEASVPVVPPIVTSHAVLVAKMVVQKAFDTAISIQSAFDTQFSMGSVGNHEDLTGLQGGTAGEHYHFTAAEYAALLALIS